MPKCKLLLVVAGSLTNRSRFTLHRPALNELLIVVDCVSWGFSFMGDVMFRLVISLIVLAVFVYLGTLFSGCSDGWGSTSIGSRGACSHHGGVSSIPMILYTLGVIGAIFTYMFLSIKPPK